MAAFNYGAFYDRLIARARTRILAGYVEKHHVIPRCMGGRDSKANIVQLTAEEHYVAHQLLAKMHPDNFGLTWSAMAMTNGTSVMRRNNKRYGWLRKKFALTLSIRSTGRKHSREAKAKMSAARLGQKRGPYRITKPFTASKGQPKSAAHREALSEAKRGNRNAIGKRSIQSCENILNGVKRAGFAHRRTPGYQGKMRNIMNGIWARRKAGDLPMPIHTSSKGD
jgi:hypothetical protein